MKNIRLIIGSMSFVFLMMIGISSCKKNDNSYSNSVSDLNSTVQQAKWKVTYYNDSGSDETNNYSGYEIKFNSGSTVAAVKGVIIINGTWLGKNDDSQLKLNLTFDNVVPFAKLNDDWHVTQQNSSIIKMEDVSGGGNGGGIDYLTLEKI